MDSALKKKTIDAIITAEGGDRPDGGYTNDLVDSGGETKYGITVATARAYGYQGKMRDLPREIAYAIYSKMYWDKLRLDDIEKMSRIIAEELADTGVNQGVGRAAEYLQRCLNAFNNLGQYYPDIKVDSAIGPKTLANLKKYLQLRGTQGEEVLFQSLNSLQGAFYIELAEKRQKDEKYVFGWMLNRVK